MKLKEHYDQLYKVSIKEISSDNYEVDPLINSDTDDRFGLSLIIRPTAEIKNKIQKFLTELQNVEPHQYYYPNSDIHITVISIISCYSGLKLSQLDIPKYVRVIENSLADLQNIVISCEGVTASPSCLMIKGFMNDNSLNELRNQLRSNFKNSGLQESMDERYLIKTAHATVFRFKENLQHKEEFLKIIDNYKDYDFGTFEVGNIELVFNDWYHQERLVNKLHQFNL